MGVFGRISNMFKAKANDALDNLENPIQLLDQKIRDMEENLNKAKLSSAQILGNVHEIEKKMKEAELESKDYDDKVKLALSKGNEDLAKKALQRKLDADKKYESLKNSYNEAYSKAETIKTNLRSLEEEIEKTRNYRDEAAARYNNAEASKKVNEILANVQTKSNSINIDDIERKIQKKESLAEGLGDLKKVDTLEDEFEALNKIDLDAELDKYKNPSSSSSVKTNSDSSLDDELSKYKDK
ncbi:PspA/IM30 family protein [Clostridium fallax]|uniref:Phage shock protein A (PspA) family protein n=1 Tax=Clostridium fallax TaxID=1533 RepID=A0A1M4VC18_9CLOT|nr:PspA/IM30 family protein [Clostridium fallax]SHE66476.1 phage shock protein A (PspA) family protein [Clostridium fallax]SQB05791.1 phage shock protein A [Clostridium fallax]